MNTGKLTPKSNTTVAAMRFSGNFAQPNGFGSVLTVKINEAGDAALTLVYKGVNDGEHMWSVMLDNTQRAMLANFLLSYKPRTYETIDPSEEGL